MLIAAAGWTALIWLFRLWNMLGDDHSAGFLVVHGVIAGISIGFAGAILVIGVRGRRSRDAGDARDADAAPVGPR